MKSGFKKIKFYIWKAKSHGKNLKKSSSFLRNKKKQIEKIDFDLQELEVEFENGLISKKDFNIKKERLNNRIIKICE